MNAQCFKNRAHRTTRNDARSRRGSAQGDLARAMPTCAIMVQGPALTQRHTDHRLLGLFRRLANGFWHFPRLAMPKADPTLLVTDHHQGREGEPTPALHRRRDTIDVHELFDDVAFAPLFDRLIAVTTITASAAFVPAPLLFATSHLRFP